MLEKGMFIEKAEVNKPIKGIFYITDVVRQNMRNGQFWLFKAQDRTGSLPAKRWPENGVLTPSTLQSCFAEIKGRVTTYKGVTEITADSIRVLTEEEAAVLSMEDFAQPSPYDGEACLNELMALADKETAGTPWQNLIRAWFDDPDNRRVFAAASAARKVHHAGRGGLAAHTLEVCKISLALASVFGDMVDRAALMTGALFHDLGKLQEMDTGLMETTYTAPGKLAGHLVLGCLMLQAYREKAGLPEELWNHLIHMLLSHHGTVEHEAVKVPATLEAFLLSQADMISAKAAVMAREMENLQPGEVSDRTPFGAEGPLWRRISTEESMKAAQKKNPQPSAPIPGPEPSDPRRLAPRQAPAPARRKSAASPAAAAPAPRSSVRDETEVPPWDDDCYLDALTREEPQDSPAESPAPDIQEKAAAPAPRAARQERRAGGQQLVDFLTTFKPRQ